MVLWGWGQGREKKIANVFLKNIYLSPLLNSNKKTYSANIDVN
jgi:hypothetical protein